MPGAAEDLPRAALEEVFSSNLFGVHELTTHAIRHMRAQGAGRIVMHSSVVGFTPLKLARRLCRHVNTRSKGLTNTMRIELRGTGIQVSILNTGPVTSGFRDNSMAQFDRWIDARRRRRTRSSTCVKWPPGARPGATLF